MKYASPALIAFLGANSQFMMADFYRITLQTGQSYYWTDADMDLVFGGQTYTTTVDQGTQPILERGEIRTARGLEVSTMDLTVYSGDTAQLLGVDITLAAHNGALDNAAVLVTRVIMPTWGDTTTLGGLVLFDGTVAAADISSTEIVLHVASKLQDLAAMMPKTLFTPQCANTFGDASCGISLASLTVAKAITAGSTTTRLYGASGAAPGYYQNGVVVFTSGLNTGTMVAVSAYDGTVLALVVPLANTPQVGDTFTVYPGCARTTAACAGFGNSSRFRGCPFVPSAETGL